MVFSRLDAEDVGLRFPGERQADGSAIAVDLAEAATALELNLEAGKKYDECAFGCVVLLIS